MISMFVMYQYHCLWCYYHVIIIVCDVIIMSVLLIDFSSSFSFFSFLFAIPHSMYITQTIYFVWYRASLGQVTGTERVTHIAFMSLKVNASRVDDVMGNLEGVMQARCVTLVKTRWRHFLSMPRVYFNLLNLTDTEWTSSSMLWCHAESQRHGRNTWATSSWRRHLSWEGGQSGDGLTPHLTVADVMPT